MALWNFTIDDTSPYLSYNPYVDGSALTKSWQTWYTDSQYNTIPDDVGRGDSYHVTSLQGANVTFQFFGTGVSLFGTSNTTFGVTIDKISQGLVNSTASLLFSKYGLAEGLHSVTLSAQTPPSNSSQLALNYASVSSPLRSDENPPSPIFYDSSNTASLEYSGTWTNETMNGVPNTTISAPFKQTTSQGATVSLSFVGGTAVAVKGMAGSANGLYSVSIDGNTRNFNGSSTWIVPDALLFFRTGLDPTSTHHINITNLSDTRLCLNSITVYQHEPKNGSSPRPPKRPPPSTRSSINIGAITGPIIGVLVLCLIGGLFWYCRRHRRAVKRRSQAQTYIPRPYSGPRRPDVTVASTVTTPAISMTSNSIPFGGSSISSNSNLLTTPEMGGYLRPNRKHPHHVSLSDVAAARKRLTRSTLGGDGWPSSPDAHSQTSMTFVDSDPSSSGRYVPRASPSSSQTFNIPESTPLSPRRKPLPGIPVPSYDAALEAAHLSPREVKSMSSLMNAPHDSLDVAPPRYER